MDTTSIGIFLLALFFGGITTGLAGFALALAVSGIWLHVILTNPNCNADRRLQPADAKLRHLEAKARAKLAEGGSVPCRRHRWCADRYGAVDIL
jgi:hypothetical protein